MVDKAIDGRERVSSSAFMRRLRPEYYSDTADRTTYQLDAPTLEYHLNTITARNQTHDFEIFCRKLCERTICPNLKPATGPEGGGDSKVDTESFPIADEIATLSYVGEPNAGSERWAFAFSAKRTWAEKVRSDVAGIVATDREETRIREKHFVNRAVVAGEIYDEGAADLPRDFLMVRKLHHVEQVPRVLPVHGSDQLSAGEILQRDERQLQIRLQDFLRLGAKRCRADRMHRSAHYEIHLDLHFELVPPDKHLRFAGVGDRGHMGLKSSGCLRRIREHVQGHDDGAGGVEGSPVGAGAHGGRAASGPRCR